MSEHGLSLETQVQITSFKSPPIRSRRRETGTSERPPSPEAFPAKMVVAVIDMVMSTGNSAELPRSVDGRKASSRCFRPQMPFYRMPTGLRRQRARRRPNVIHSSSPGRSTDLLPNVTGIPRGCPQVKSARK